ncbi:pilin [Paraburkholderia aromaticivorans]|uniref:pilin n=1 Tax=Paraburkholderia aromaticivorans TaxID=2026199 RepID=UPI0038B95F52
MKSEINIKLKGKKNGFVLLMLMALISAASLLAMFATNYLIDERDQVWEAIGQAQGLTVAASGIAAKNHGIPPSSISDFGVQALPGSTYASYTVSNGNIIVTFGDTAHGSFSPVFRIIQNATIDYAPHPNPDGSVSYYCTINNNFFKQFFAITQCNQNPSS